ncbi:hypothetical protein GLOIN_2v1587390 [Rhizophagus irregularis DAOM 181602=DAOM 197198]|nr:hypothetical protein GLOIN_2v1587390 [Rhizophagus irregularis DAOM 181602=DAOM 197198]
MPYSTKYKQHIYRAKSAEHDSYLVENWDTETLIVFLKEQNLKLDDDDLGILRKQKIDGQSLSGNFSQRFYRERTHHEA